MKYRKKPMVVDAIRWNGDNADDIEKLFGRLPSSLVGAERGCWITKDEDGEIAYWHEDWFAANFEPLKETP